MKANQIRPQANYTNKQIFVLETDEGTEISDQDKLLLETKKNYQKLYTSRNSFENKNIIVHFR